MSLASGKRREIDEAQRAAVRNYEFLCITAVLVLALTELLQDYGQWCLLTLLVGISGVVGRWAASPILLLGTQGVLIAAQLLASYYVREAPNVFRPPTGFHPEYLVQAAAVLAYSAGHYRLQGLTRMVLPSDARAVGAPVKDAAGLGAPSRRPVPANEVLRLLGAALGWALAAQVVWGGLPEGGTEFARPIERLVALIWLLAVVVFVIAGLIAHQGRTQARPEAARLYLQDVLWQETRAEQRRLNRWLAWARIRYRRRKDVP